MFPLLSPSWVRCIWLCFPFLRAQPIPAALLCFPPNFFPALPVSCHEGLCLESSSQSWIRRAVPVGCSCVLQDTHRSPWPGWAVIGASFPPPASSWTQHCFWPALPFFFQGFYQLLSIPEKRETGTASSLGSRTCWATAEIPSCYFLFSSLFFSQGS